MELLLTADHSPVQGSLVCDSELLCLQEQGPRSDVLVMHGKNPTAAPEDAASPAAQRGLQVAVSADGAVSAPVGQVTCPSLCCQCPRLLPAILIISRTGMPGHPGSRA